MFIQTEETPNPATLKFLPGRQVMASGTAEFKVEEEAARSPLAQALFQVDGVTGVFLGYDFISVSKRDDKEWYLMKPGVLGVIMEHFVAGRPTILDSAAPDADAVADAGEDSEIVAQIKELLPGLRGRGGDAADAGGMLRLPEFDGDPEDGHREHAPALHSRGPGGPRLHVLRHLPPHWGFSEAAGTPPGSGRSIPR